MKNSFHLIRWSKAFSVVVETISCNEFIIELEKNTHQGYSVLGFVPTAISSTLTGSPSVPNFVHHIDVLSTPDDRFVANTRAFITWVSESSPRVKASNKPEIFIN